LEDASIYLDLLNTRSIELFQGGYNSCLLSGAGWSVNEQVREVTALSLEQYQ
jgi:hypothetical protein